MVFQRAVFRVCSTIGRRFIAKEASTLFVNKQLPLNYAKQVRFLSSEIQGKMVKHEIKGANNNIAVVSLNRPKALNSLCDELISELGQLFKKLDQDSSVACIILTGNSPKAFAAGADIKEMSEMDFASVMKGNFLADLDLVANTKKPVIAAVNGYALGGGCELAMMCDIIYASDKAVFGQPEILLGTIPGAGGTQRLTRAIGKYKAMEWVLTGEKYGAIEAEKAGLVAKVFPHDQLMAEALKTAEKIARNSGLINMICKEAVDTAMETSLEEGIHFEKRLFHATFATEDRKEGMAAFVGKRAPKFQNK